MGNKQRAYAEMYRHEIVKALPIPRPGSGQTIYSTACYTHCSLSSHTFYKIQADGVGLFPLLEKWTRTTNPDEATGYLVDRCDGFNCGRRQAQVTTTAEPSEAISDGAQGSSGGWFEWPGWSWLR